jgi:hypothetical protein
LGGELEHGAEEIVLGIADGELGRVDTDSETAGAGGDVVARKGALVFFGELPVAIQRQRLGRDDVASEEMSAKIHGQNLPLRASK